MSKEDYQNLMSQVFKGTFISNLLTKLLLKEITTEDFNIMITKKKNKISLDNPSMTEEQKYSILMLAKDEVIDNVINTNTEKNDNIKKNSKPFNFYIIYIILLISFLASSMLMTFLNIKLGKTVLIKDEVESNDINIRSLEQLNNKEDQVDLSVGKDIKLNLKNYTFVILPKMKKIIFPTFEGLLGFLIKYGISIVNVLVAIFGRFFDKNNIKRLKMHICIIFFFLPIIRVYTLNKINKEFINSYNHNIAYYKSNELFNYNPKSLPYNLYTEIANSLFSMFLALNHISSYMIDSFYKSNSSISDYIKKFFDIKNKLN